MTQVDQFESIFRSALVDIYEYELIDIKSVLLVTDHTEDEIQDYLHDLQRFLAVLGTSVEWNILSGENFATTQELLDHVAKEKPDLICSYRNLHSKAWQHPHSLGAHLDVLIQKAQVPVMILPHPDADYAHDHAFENTDKVMAITDHLSNDHRLVNFATRFTQVDGSIFLTHIEGQKIFDRYIEAISKIPSIDTEDATDKIREQLLKEPRNYIGSCKQVLHENNLPVSIEAIVTFGHRISEYEALILDHGIDLLVMNAKDDDQQAMHGMVYPLAVELRQIPLLML